MPTSADQHCLTPDRIQAALAGKLPDADWLRLERHLLHCAACRAAYRTAATDHFPTCDNYTIIRKVGQGGFGIVYQALHHAKQRTEALKVLTPKSPLDARLFTNEVHLIASLRHPNIATLYDAQLDDEPKFFSMEFVHGQRFNDYLKNHAVTLGERVRIVKTVAEAVGYAHRQGVLHRDLKPQNILIDADGIPRIVDFGIAKRFTAHGPDDAPARGSDSDDKPAGTLGYIAPEQMAGAGVDGRADIYSLGALLFFSITGEHPRLVRQPEKVQALLHKRKIAQAADLAAIIRHCTQREPHLRYPNCDALSLDLQRFLVGEPISAGRAPSAAYRVARLATYQFRNHPMLTRVALVTLVALVLAPLYRTLEATWYVPAPVTDESDVVLVAYDERTEAAYTAGELTDRLPRVSPLDRKSLRVLYGELVRRIAAAEPRVIVLDYYFPDCHPEFDQPLLNALDNTDVPVIVGDKQFDRAGMPNTCPQLLERAAGCGALFGRKPRFPHEFDVLAYIQRGFEAPIPSLSVLAFAAARFPDAHPVLRIEADRLVLRYRKRAPRTGEPRFIPNAEDRIPLPLERVALEGQERLVVAGDTVAFLKVPGNDVGAWRDAALNMLAVLHARPDELRERMHGRVVILGQTLGGLDRYTLRDDTTVYGCEVQAQAIQALLRGETPQRFSRLDLLTRVFGWAIIGAALAAFAPGFASIKLRWVVLVCVPCLAGGGGLALATSLLLRERLVVEAAIAVNVLLLVVPLIVLARAVRNRALELLPDEFNIADPDTTVSSTVFVPEAVAESRSQKANQEVDAV